MTRDPVNDFEIPEEWMERSKIPKKELVAGIESGRMLLLSDGSVLKRGLTTGTTAAAAAKGAVIALYSVLGDVSDISDISNISYTSETSNISVHISVPTPIGIRADTMVQIN